MIACVELPSGLCIVKRVRRVSFHAGALTYCNVEANASEGTVQVPDDVFKEVIEWDAVSAPGKKLKPCLACKKATRL